MLKRKRSPDGGIVPGLPSKKGKDTTEEEAPKKASDENPSSGIETEEFRVEEGEDTEFPVVSQGIHPAKVLDIEQGESQNGNQQYVWDFTVTAGEDKGKRIRYWTSLVPQARWKLTEALRALGLEAEGSVFKFSRDQLVGKPCRLKVGFDRDRDRYRIDKVLPPDDKAIQAASETPVV